MEVEQERNRKNVAKLEFNIVEQIRALFDAREVHFDKIEEHNNSIKEINRILDYYNRRIF